MTLIPTLAQAPSAGLFGSNPPPLPPAPVWERWLLEAPLWPAILLLIAAVAALVLLNRAGKPRQALRAAGTCALAAAAVFALGTLVTTTRETLTARTEALVAAVARADTATIAGLLAPDAVVRPSGPIPAMTRDAILDFIDTNMNGRYRLENYRVLEVQPAVDGVNLARTQTHVRVTPAAWSTPAFTWWRLDWRKDQDGQWHVTSIEVLNLQ